MPIVLRHFTYKQCLDQIKIHGKEVLTNEEIEMLEIAGDKFNETAYLAGELAPVYFGSALNNLNFSIS